jgi:hypothetical protein
MLRWERRRSGFYRLLHITKRKTWPYTNEEGIVAEVVKGADGRWWMEYLDTRQGWIYNRCKTLGNAKAVAVECCKT